MNNKMTRRKFAQIAGATAVAAPALGSPAAAQQAPPAPTAADTKPKYGMTNEQEARVKQSVERGERGRAPLRAYPLSYAAEPSFVFKARVRAK